MGAQGYVSAFLASGCPATVGALWEIGSNDTDIFTENILRECHNRETQFDEIIALARQQKSIKMATTRFALVYYGIPLRMDWRKQIGKRKTNKQNNIRK